MAAAAQARLLASPAIRTLIGRRLAELGGVVLGLGGVGLLVALACYNPLDPSFNTATARVATNLAGQAGAIAADLLLQSFGLAAVLPSVAMLAWSFRIASHRGLGSFAARLASTLAAMPVAASVLAAVPTSLKFPSEAGPGGAIGTVLAQSAASYAQALAGPFGAPLAALAATVASGLLIWASLGVSRRPALTAAGVARAAAKPARRPATAAKPVARARFAFLFRRSPPRAQLAGVRPASRGPAPG